jgi:hypothetical protein
MDIDPRCCGSGTCIVNAEGRCWCGQQWNGTEMCAPALAPASSADRSGVEADVNTDAAPTGD